MAIEHKEDVEKYRVGLALFNESAAESIHMDFEQHYGYLVKDVTTSSYHERLLKAVQSYIAIHI